MFAASLAIRVYSIAYYMLARPIESQMVVRQSAGHRRVNAHHRPSSREPAS
jgi:hypothetical protein